MSPRRTKIAIGTVAVLAIGALYALSEGAPIPTGWKKLAVLVLVVGPLMLVAPVIFEIVCGGVGFAVCTVLGKVPRIGPFFRRLEGDAVGIVGVITILLALVAWSMGPSTCER